MNIPFVYSLIYSQQTAHVGGSNSFLPFLLALSPPGANLTSLQCFSSILIIGSLDTAYVSALFFYLFLSASYSEILLTISNMSSPGLKELS